MYEDWSMLRIKNLDLHKFKFPQNRMNKIKQNKHLQNVATCMTNFCIRQRTNFLVYLYSMTWTLKTITATNFVSQNLLIIRHPCILLEPFRLLFVGNNCKSSWTFVWAEHRNFWHCSKVFISANAKGTHTCEWFLKIISIFFQQPLEYCFSYIINFLGYDE